MDEHTITAEVTASSVPTLADIVAALRTTGDTGGIGGIGGIGGADGSRVADRGCASCGDRCSTRRGAARGFRLWQRVYRGRIDAGLERCRQCGARHHRGAPLTFDHLRARSLGGPQTLANTTILCRRCNNRKGTEWWPWLRSLAEEEAAAPASQRWYVLAAVADLRARGYRYARAGIDGCAITLDRRRRTTMCAGCTLHADARLVLADRAAVLDHVRAHRDAGDHVPAWVDDLITGAPPDEPGGDPVEVAGPPPEAAPRRAAPQVQQQLVGAGR